MGPWELVLIFAILLLLFGGRRLPGIASGLGGAIRNFKSSLKEPENEPKVLNGEKTETAEAQTNQGAPAEKTPSA
jgi:sec-independent protein translocase protein TatA